MSPPQPGNGKGGTPNGQESAADVAHELRQPLAAASNYIGVARLLIGSLQGDAAARALHSLGEAEAQLIRAGKILGRLSRAARPESPERD